MGDNEFINEIPNLLQIKFCCRVRVHHGSVIDVFAFLFHKSAHREFLYVDVGSDKRRELWRKVTNESRLDAAVIDQAWHFRSTSGR